MKNLKKAIALTLATVMALSMVACGTPAEKDESASGELQGASGETFTPPTDEKIDVPDFSLGLSEDGYYEGIDLTEHVEFMENYPAIPVNPSDLEPAESVWTEYASQMKMHICPRTPKENESIENGDYAVILVDGEKDPITIEVGAGYYMEELETALVGLKVKDRASFTVSVPKEGQYDVMEDKTVSFTVVEAYDVEELSNELIDAAFGETANIHTMAEFMADFRQRAIDARAEMLVYDLVSKVATVKDIPKAIIDSAAKTQTEWMFYDPISKKQDIENGYKTLHDWGFNSAAEYEEYMREIVPDEISDSLALLAIAQKEGMTADKELAMECFGRSYEEEVEIFSEASVNQELLMYQAKQFLKQNIATDVSAPVTVADPFLDIRYPEISEEFLATLEGK